MKLRVGGHSQVSVQSVQYVEWRVAFQNRLYGLADRQYQVEANYVAPDGTTFSDEHTQIVQRSQSSVVFRARAGNAAGGAFVPGTYTVNFYLNTQPFAERKFRVVADARSPYGGGGGGGYRGGGGGGGSYSGGAGGPDTPTVASGTIRGIGGLGSAVLELRLRPQPNGFLEGEMRVGLAGYGLTQIKGFQRGAHVEFQVAYGANTFDFDGARNGDTFSGSYEATPSGQHGTWTATSN